MTGIERIYTDKIICERLIRVLPKNSDAEEEVLVVMPIAAKKNR